MHFSLMSFLPILGATLSEARKHAEQAGQMGLISKDQLAAFVETKVAAFDPKVEGDSILHDEERRELARFLSGITLHLIGAERKKAAARADLEHQSEGKKP